MLLSYSHVFLAHTFKVGEKSGFGWQDVWFGDRFKVFDKLSMSRP